MIGRRAKRREGVTTLPGTPRPVAVVNDGRSPGSRVEGLAGLPGPWTSGMDDKPSPLTVAGAATVSAPFGSSSPCSLLIPPALPREPSAPDRSRSDRLSSTSRAFSDDPAPCSTADQSDCTGIQAAFLSQLANGSGRLRQRSGLNVWASSRQASSSARIFVSSIGSAPMKTISCRRSPQTGSR